MAVDPTQCDALADLARLSLSDEERPRLAADLDAILGYLNTLAEVDVASLAPAGADNCAALRPDRAGETLDRDVALQLAPRVRGEFLVVPKFMEE